ncbi:hypothetical protein FSARC_7045, partial [Fusarium sarcochroum]
MNDSVKPPIYPRYCFQLAPSVNKFCPFRIAEIYRLDQHEGFEVENFFFHGNIPIKWVRIVGLVVAIDEFWGRRVFTIDDSSGACIECIIAVTASTGEDGSATKMGEAASEKVDADGNKAPNPIPDDIDVGCVVNVRAYLSTFRDERQLTIFDMVILQTTEEEIKLWKKRVEWQSDVLQKPWILRNRDIRRCRKEAEQDEEEEERKRAEEEAEADKKRKRIKAMVDPRIAKQPPKPAGQKQPSVKKQERPSRETRLDLRQIVLEQGERGKYDALG